MEIFALTRLSSSHLTSVPDDSDMSPASAVDGDPTSEYFPPPLPIEMLSVQPFASVDYR